jgi:hypothetical protein
MQLWVNSFFEQYHKKHKEATKRTKEYAIMVIPQKTLRNMQILVNSGFCFCISEKKKLILNIHALWNKVSYRKKWR